MRKIETTPSGQFKVRFRYGTSPRTGKPMQTSETFHNKKDAEQFARWLDALGPQGALDQLYEGEQRADVPTLSELAADHIEHLTGIEDGTRKNYQRLWDRTWGPRIGHIQAHALTRDHIAQAVNDLGKHYSHKSLENQRGLLSAVVQRAVEHEHLPKNIAKGIRLPRGQEAERVEMRILTPDEFDLVVSRVREHFRPLVRFLAGTGCRWGEAVALQVGDLDLKHRVNGNAQPLVYFRRALKWSPDGERLVGPTKTRKSKRRIALPPELVGELAELIAGRPKTDLVFTALRGGEVHHRTFWERVWLPAVGDVKCKEHKSEDRPDPECSACRVSLEPRPRIHDLRHTHASWLLAAGVPIYVVQARLGHESIQTTVDTYGHLLPDAQIQAANAASIAFAQRPALS